MIPYPTNISADNFIDLVNLYANQQQEAKINKDAHDNYLLLSANWLAENQQNQDIGLPLKPLPVMPNAIHWNDDGTVTHSVFPDLKVPTVRTVNSASGTGKIASAPETDRTDKIMVALGQVLQELSAVKEHMEVLLIRSLPINQK